MEQKNISDAEISAALAEIVAELADEQKARVYALRCRKRGRSKSKAEAARLALICRIGEYLDTQRLGGNTIS